MRPQKLSERYVNHVGLEKVYPILNASRKCESRQIDNHLSFSPTVIGNTFRDLLCAKLYSNNRFSYLTLLATYNHMMWSLWLSPLDG